MFSQTVEYALRAVVYLANDPHVGRTTEQIAGVTLVPQAYLSKVMQQLAVAGLVRAQRGIGGGFTLLKEPDELTILEIVNAVDPIKRIRTCPLGLAAHGVRLCPLHKRMDQAMESVEEAFAKSTLAEILAEPTESVPLCAFPAAKGKSVRVKSKTC
jgi:Rrf2 family transcriptional regulator, nitric oxide-sensitive transcriptional repressor